MRRHSPFRSVVALVLTVTLTACYSYVPLENASPARGDEVRVHLTPEGASSRSPAQEEGAHLQGVVVRSGPDSLAFWRRPMVRSGTRVDEFERDTVAVAVAHVDRIERSEMDAVKTGGVVLLGLGVIAGMAVLVANADPGGSGDLGGGNGGGTLNLQVPLP